MNQTEKEEQIVDGEKPNLWKKWLKRFGIGGLIFFTVKGCITLSIILFGGSWLFNGCNKGEQEEIVSDEIDISLDITAPFSQ